MSRRINVTAGSIRQSRSVRRRLGVQHGTADRQQGRERADGLLLRELRALEHAGRQAAVDSFGLRAIGAGVTLGRSLAGARDH